jgi:hypothetical protein
MLNLLVCKLMQDLILRASSQLSTFFEGGLPWRQEANAVTGEIHIKVPVALASDG